MRYILHLLILIVFIFQSYAKANTDLLKEIDQSITQINQLIDVSSINIKFDSSSKSDIDLNNDSISQTAFKDQIDPQALQSFFDKLTVRTAILYPNSILSIDFPEYEFLSLLDQSKLHNSQDNYPKITPIKLTYLDNSSELINDRYISLQDITNSINSGKLDLGKLNKFEDYLVKNNFGPVLFGFYQSKPIKSIQVKIEFPVSKLNTIILNKDQTELDLDLGMIEGIQVSSNKISYILPEGLSERISVIAYYKDGRVLKERANSSNTLIDDNTKQVYQKIIEKLQEVRLLVIENKFESSQQLYQYIDDLLRPEQDKLSRINNKVQVIREFFAPIERIEFKLNTGEKENYIIYSSYNINYSEYEKDYILARELYKEKNNIGILAKGGEWLIKPQFSEGFTMIGYNYFNYSSEYNNEIYHFNLVNNEIKKVNYFLSDSKLYNSNFVKIKQNINGLLGLANIDNGNISLPMKHLSLEILDDKFWLASDEHRNKGVYDLNFNIILPFKFHQIDYFDDLFEVTINHKKDIYDLSGKRLSQIEYDHKIGTFNDGLLLINKFDQTKDIEQKFFINKKGKIAINFDILGINNAMPFSLGLAAARDDKTKKWGFINTEGKWVIPPSFEDIALPFLNSSQYALVVLNSQEVFIDKLGNVVKMLPNKARDFNSIPDEKGCVIWDWNEQCYDSFGELVIQ